MMNGLNIQRLGRQLEERLGLALIAREETVDGGVFSTLRPACLEEGNGFSVVVSRSPRQVEASFRADNFAAGLIEKMADADDAARSTFRTLLAETRGNQAHVYLAVDGLSADDLPASKTGWRKVEIDVRQRISAGKVTPDALFEGALWVTSNVMSLVLSLLPTETVAEPSASDVQGLPEGARVRVEVNRYERSPANRAACIAHYGPVCQGCGFCFRSFYGDLGEGYIEVHHRVPVSQMGEAYFVNPVRDLVPVCGNCHAMLHRSDPPMTVESLRTLVESLRGS